MFRTYSDGFCKPNPGVMGIGGVILEEDTIIAENCENHAWGTNNPGSNLDGNFIQISNSVFRQVVSMHLEDRSDLSQL